jgi:hypothetical protein
VDRNLTPEEFLAKILEPAKQTDHICWKCKHLKPVLKDSAYPPADLIGYCKKIHWPFFWCVSEYDVVKKCYAYEARG